MSFEPDNYRRPAKGPASPPAIPDDLLIWMRAFVERGIRYDHAIVGYRNHKFTLNRAVDNPCHGELRKYAAVHSTATRNEDRPADLSNPVQIGTPLAAGIVSFGIKSMFLVPGESPYEPLKPGAQELLDNGIVVRNTRVDQTVLVSALSIAPRINLPQLEKCLALGEPFWKALLVSVTWRGCVVGLDDYYLPSKFSLTRWKEGRPIDVSSPPWDEEAGNWWYDGIDYNRVSLHKIWAGPTQLTSYRGSTLEGYLEFLDERLEAEKGLPVITREMVMKEEDGYHIENDDEGHYDDDFDF